MPIFNPNAETMDRQDLLELQNERLQIVVNQAYSNVDFYRRKFDEAGLSPDDIKTLDDLKKIPFTTRKDLMENYPYGMFAVPLAGRGPAPVSAGALRQPDRDRLYPEGPGDLARAGGPDHGRDRDQRA